MMVFNCKACGKPIVFMYFILFPSCLFCLTLIK